MADALGTMLFLGSCLVVLWGVAGLIRPRIVLWWAIPEKQTRLRAFLWSILLAATIFTAALLSDPSLDWWIYFVPIALLLGTIQCGRSFRLTAEEQKRNHQEWLTRMEKAKEESKLALEANAAELERLKKEREIEKKIKTWKTAVSATSNKTYEINPYLIECTCPDWEERRSDAYGIFRCCKHLTLHYMIFPDDIPDQLTRYTKLLSAFGCEDKGIPYAQDIAKSGGKEHDAYIITGSTASLPWVNVYTAWDTSRYGFNVRTGKWAKGNEPLNAEAIAEAARREAVIYGE